MKEKPCKYCRGTGKVVIKDEANSEMKIFGTIFGGRTINKPCPKCHGTAKRMIGGKHYGK